MIWQQHEGGGDAEGGNPAGEADPSAGRGAEGEVVLFSLPSSCEESPGGVAAERDADDLARIQGGVPATEGEHVGLAQTEGEDIPVEEVLRSHVYEWRIDV
jgi:hypothetical protein